MKYFIFDMGGVLKKSSTSSNYFRKKIATYANSDDPETKKMLDEKYTKYMAGLISTEQYVNSVGPYLNKKNMSASEFKREFLFVNKKYGELFENTNYIIDMLKEKGYKVYLLSNLIEYAYLGFKDLFDVNKFDKVYLSYELHLLKPDKKLYSYVINDINTDPKNIYFFDDNKLNVTSAKKCGINAICTTGDNLLNEINKIIK